MLLRRAENCFGQFCIADTFPGHQSSGKVTMYERGRIFFCALQKTVFITLKRFLTQLYRVCSDLLNGAFGQQITQCSLCQFKHPFASIAAVFFFFLN
ncbi:unnamed protein product [Ixodes persulcatus]